MEMNKSSGILFIRFILTHDYRTRFYSHTSQDSVTSKLQAILRPFIFSVHPDLFGHHPLPKSVNETSLKLLNEYIQSSAVERKAISTQSLKFYQRVQQDTSDVSKGDLKVIKVRLTEDMLQSVRLLLAESELPLDDVDAYIEECHHVTPSPDQPIDWIHSHYFAATGKQYPFTDVWEEISKLKPAVTLHRWVSHNIKATKHLELSTAQLRKNCCELQEQIINKYGLTNVVWSCGWRGTHQLSSLRNLDHLLFLEPQYRELVAKRKIIFGNERGVTMNGDIALSSDDVPQQWAEMLSTVSASDKYLDMIPAAEQQLSSLLNHVQVVRRSDPPIPMANAYYSSLASLVSRFGMSRMMSSTNLSKSRSHLQLSVTGTMGDEITVTPQGHISVPSHSPVWAIMRFIEDNEGAALDMGKKYTEDRTEAERLMDIVVEDYRLQSLTIDSSISYEQAIRCCDNLLASSETVRYMLEGVRICIAPYFAVMSDGEMCITWDWLSETC